MPVFKIKPFLPEVTKDPRNVTKKFRGLGIIPYASTSTGTAQSYLDLLFSLYELAPSHGICISNLNAWAFGGDIGFRAVGMPGLMTSLDANTLLPDSELVRITEQLSELGISLSDVKGLQQQMFKHYKVCGNAWLRVVITKAAKAYAVVLEVIDPRNVGLLERDKKTGIQSLVWSPDKPLNSKDESKLKLSRVWPATMQSGRDVEFFFHFSTGGSEYYGRPDTVMAIMPMIVEARQEVLHANIANTDLAVKFLLLVQEVTVAGDEQEGTQPSAAQSVVKSIRDIGGKADIEGNSQVMAAIGYPEDAETPQVVKLDGNRDSQYFQFTSNNASAKIFAAHNWSKILSGFETAPAGIGANIILDEFKVKNITTIKPIQEEWAENWANVLSAIASITGIDVLDGVAPVFQDRIASMVESLTVTQQTQTL